MHNVYSDLDLTDVSDSPPIAGMHQLVYNSQMMTIWQEDAETILK